MSVLTEAISVVVLRAAAEKAYAGGAAGLASDAPGETFCADGYLLRVGFFNPEDARFFVDLLVAGGLERSRNGIAADFVVVDQNVGPLTPCLWLETGTERDGTPVAWHAAARRGDLHAPIGWRPLRGGRLGDWPGRPFSRLVRFVKREDRTDWFHDRHTGRLVGMPRPFTAH